MERALARHPSKMVASNDPWGHGMFRKLGLIAALVLLTSQAQALCIVNRTSDTVAYTRGEPFLGMEILYAGTVRPGAQHCASISARSDGTYPVSVYSVTKRGKCAVVRGCFYGSAAEQVFFDGSASSTCPIAFQDNSCS